MQAHCYNMEPKSLDFKDGRGFGVFTATVAAEIYNDCILLLKNQPPRQKRAQKIPANLCAPLYKSKGDIIPLLHLQSNNLLLTPRNTRSRPFNRLPIKLLLLLDPNPFKLLITRPCSHIKLYAVLLKYCRQNSCELDSCKSFAGAGSHLFAETEERAFDRFEERSHGLGIERRLF